MKTNKTNAGLVLGAVCFMISTRSAMAAEPGTSAPDAPGPSAVQGSTEPVSDSPRILSTQGGDDEGPDPGGGALLAADSIDLQGVTLYEAAGRQDLVEQYRNRHAGRSLLIGGGAVAIGVGFVWLLWNSLPLLAPCLSTNCEKPDVETTAPFITMAAGGAMIFGSVFISDDPVSAAEKEDLRRIAARRLRLTSMQIGAAPAANGAGGSFVVAGRF